MPHCAEQGKRSSPDTPVAAGEQATSKYRVVVRVMVGAGSTVVPGATAVQQLQAEEYWPEEGQFPVA